MSAKEKALFNNPIIIDLSPSTTEVLNAARKCGNFPRCMLVNGRAVDLTPKAVEMIGWLVTGTGVVTDEELTQLRAIEEKQREVQSRITEFGTSRVTPYLQTKQAAIELAVAAGNHPVDVTLPSRSQVEQTFAARRNALNASLVKITAEEVAPICKTVIDRLSAALEQSMRDGEEGEREQAAVMDLPFEPSLQWKAMASFCVRVVSRRLPAPGAVVFPSHVLENLAQI